MSFGQISNQWTFSSVCWHTSIPAWYGLIMTIIFLWPSDAPQVSKNKTKKFVWFYGIIFFPRSTSVLWDENEKRLVNVDLINIFTRKLFEEAIIVISAGAVFRLLMTAKIDRPFLVYCPLLCTVPCIHKLFSKSCMYNCLWVKQNPACSFYERWKMYIFGWFVLICLHLEWSFYIYGFSLLKIFLDFGGNYATFT